VNKQKTPSSFALFHYLRALCFCDGNFNFNLLHGLRLSRRCSFNLGQGIGLGPKLDDRCSHVSRRLFGSLVMGQKGKKISKCHKYQ